MSNRRKIYVQGTRGVRVPFTEVALSPTVTKAGVSDNAPIFALDQKISKLACADKRARA